MNTERIPRLPGERNFGNEIESDHALRYVKKLRNVISACHDRARRCVEAYWSNMERQFDKHHKDATLKTGSWVLVQLTDAERRKSPVPKLAPRWSRPAEIVKVLSNGVTYVVKLANGEERTRHISNLLPIPEAAWGQTYPEPAEERKVSTPVAKGACEDDSDDEVEITFSTQSHTPATGNESTPPVQTTPVQYSFARSTPRSSSPIVELSAEPGTPYYHVEQLLEKRVDNRVPFYLVKWTGYNTPSWVSRKTLMEDCPSLVRQYERQARPR